MADLDFIEAYDLAVRAWVVNTLSGVITGKTVNTILAPPNRALEVDRTTIQAGQDRPKLPIVSIYRQEGPMDSPIEKTHTGWVRKLGYSQAQAQTRLKRRRGRMPMPITLPYMLDIWTEKMGEANLIAQRLMWMDTQTAKWLKIWAGDVWGWKYATLVGGRQIINNTNLESPERVGIRLTRYSIPVSFEAWLFDQAGVTEVDVARQILIQFYDYNTEDHWETVYYPPRRQIGTGDGVGMVFGTVAGEVQERTVLVISTCGGDLVCGYDDGNGVIAGTGISGTVVYSTGTISATFTVPPDLGASVDAGYVLEV